MNAFRGRGICLAPGFFNAAEDLEDFFWVVDDDCRSSGSARRRLFCGEGGNFAGMILSAGVGFLVTIVGARCGSFP